MQLSHSALNVFSACERKFAHKYMQRTPVDADYKSGHALNFGSAYHRVLEMCRHDHRQCTTELMQGACMEFGLSWDSDGAKIAACLRSYFAGFDPEWKCTHTEVWWETEEHKGQIDAIFQHISNDGRWRICDLKTSGLKLIPNIREKLLTDQQVAMYIEQVALLAKMCGLDPAKFDGITYREVEKPRQRYKNDIKEKHEELEFASDAEGDEVPVPKMTIKTRPETWAEFTQRCGNPPYRDTVMRAEEFTLQADNMQNIRAKVSRVRMIDTVEQTVKNMEACMKWNMPCEYWSQCHNGKTYSEFSASPADANIANANPISVGVIEDDADKF